MEGIHGPSFQGAFGPRWTQYVIEGRAVKLTVLCRRCYEFPIECVPQRPIILAAREASHEDAMERLRRARRGNRRTRGIRNSSRTGSNGGQISRAQRPGRRHPRRAPVRRAFGHDALEPGGARARRPHHGRRPRPCHSIGRGRDRPLECDGHARHDRRTCPHQHRRRSPRPSAR